jgi:hypothetical protein
VLSRGEPDSLGDAHLDVAGLCGCGHGDLPPRQSSPHGLLKASSSASSSLAGHRSPWVATRSAMGCRRGWRRPKVGQRMRCAGASSGSGADDRAGATWAELEGGPGEHRRRPGRAPAADHVDWVDRATGQAQRGQSTPATAEGWAGGWGSCPTTLGRSRWRRAGWRLVVEELQAVGWQACLAEPAETAALGGPSGGPRPTGPTPSCWGAAGARSPAPGVDPPAHLPGAGGAGAAAQALVDQGAAFQQRLHAVLFTTACPAPTWPADPGTRSWLEQVALP